jgi:hypothetical protein
VGQDVGDWTTAGEIGVDSAGFHTQLENLDRLFVSPLPDKLKIKPDELPFAKVVNVCLRYFQRTIPHDSGFKMRTLGS